VKVELDVLRRQVVEQPSPLPEQDRYDVQSQLVELPGPQQRLRRPGPVHHHLAVPGRRAGLRGALAHLGDVADAARRRVVRDVVGQDEELNRRDPSMPIGASTLSCGPET
jgi:hypothetical protein